MRPSVRYSFLTYCGVELVGLFLFGCGKLKTAGKEDVYTLAAMLQIDGSRWANSSNQPANHKGHFLINPKRGRCYVEATRVTFAVLVSSLNDSVNTFLT